MYRISQIFINKVLLLIRLSTVKLFNYKKFYYSMKNESYGMMPIYSLILFQIPPLAYKNQN